MGEVAETMTKKKKKGRPSLLDLQKRALKQQQLEEQQQQLQQRRSSFKNPNSLNRTPASGRRSTRRNSNSDGISPESPWIDEGDDDDERKEKKHKLLHGLNSHGHRRSPVPSANSSGPNSLSGGSDLNADDAGEISGASLKRRRIGSVSYGSDEMGEKGSKATDLQHESQVESGPTTPLPDKKLLVFILDRLQKKDTYGVFSEPVDPKELPDYHEIIAHPMDFSTLRKKLDGGAYANLEQFERDVFLICTNAMEYNSPDTIYFRQARTMQELAKKDFANLRQDSDDGEPEPQPHPQPKVVRRGRPPKKLLDTPSVDHVASEFFGGAILASGAESSALSNGYNLRKVPNPHKLRLSDTFARATHTPSSGENHNGWSNEWENEFPASVVRAVTKYGMKHFHVDENRRDTYNQAMAIVHEPDVHATLEGELKQLLPVGLSTEYGYARSLARFAANLGPTAWRIASKKIETVLPAGHKFGPGWVGESSVFEEPHQQSLFYSKQKIVNNSQSDDHSSRILSPSTSVSNSMVGNKHSLQGGEDSESSQRLNSGNGINPSSSSLQILEPKPLINSYRNGYTGGFAFNHSNQIGSLKHAMSGVPRNGFSSIGPQWTEGPSSRRDVRNVMSSGPTIGSHPRTIEGIQGTALSQGFPSTHQKRDMHQLPPDLNTDFLKPGSPGSSLQIGSPKQPDLALQL